MGYTTIFKGKMILDREMTEPQIKYLKAFSETRRMKRNPELISRQDELSKAVGLPLGPEGAFYISDAGFMGQDRTPDVIDSNEPPHSQPSLWCQWIVGDDRRSIEWDRGEKFYGYIPWIIYIIENFLKPWGYVLNGSMKFQGEDRLDGGTFRITDNVVSVSEISSPRRSFQNWILEE